MSHSTGSRQSHSSTSGRTITHTRQLWICNDCWSKEKARQARAVALTITVILLIGLGILAWITLSGRKGASQSVETPSNGQTASEPAPSALIRQSPAEQPTTITANNPTNQTTEPSVASASPPPPVTPETNSDLKAAILQGLDNGQAGRWRGGDLSGGYSFSPEQPSVGKTCRNYRYTVERDGEEMKTSDGTACKLDGDDWVITPS